MVVACRAGVDIDGHAYLGRAGEVAPLAVEAAAYSDIAAVDSPWVAEVGIPFAGAVAFPSEVEVPPSVEAAFPFADQGCMDMGSGWDIPDPGIPGYSSGS